MKELFKVEKESNGWVAKNRVTGDIAEWKRYEKREGAVIAANYWNEIHEINSIGE